MRQQHLTLMGGGWWEVGNTGCYHSDKGLLSTSEIMSKGKQELVDIYWQCVTIETFKSIRPAIMGCLQV